MNEEDHLYKVLKDLQIYTDCLIKKILNYSFSISMHNG